MKIRSVGAELLHVDRRKDGRTDRRRDNMKLIVAVRNFVDAPKMICVLSIDVYGCNSLVLLQNRSLYVYLWFIERR